MRAWSRRSDLPGVNKKLPHLVLAAFAQSSALACHYAAQWNENAPTSHALAPDEAIVISELERGQATAHAR